MLVSLNCTVILGTRAGHWIWIQISDFLDSYPFMDLWICLMDMDLLMDIYLIKVKMPRYLLSIEIFSVIKVSLHD